MKTIITSTGDSTVSTFDEKFGRSGWFCLYDGETAETEFYENQSKNSSNGAGIKAAEKVIELGAVKVVSGDFGPKAKDMLNKFNVQMVIIDDRDVSIKDILYKLNNK